MNNIMIKDNRNNNNKFRLSLYKILKQQQRKLKIYNQSKIFMQNIKDKHHQENQVGFKQIVKKVKLSLVSRMMILK